MFGNTPRAHRGTHAVHNMARVARLTYGGMRAAHGSAGVNAPGRNRTCDLALRRRTLYPLSYRREGV